MDRETHVPATIDAYIRTFPKTVQVKLQQLRRIVARAAPGAAEKISYGMPTFFQNGNLVHFAAYTRHIGFYPTPSAIEAFARELAKYKSSKGAVQFPLDEPLPADLIRRMVEFRVKENTKRR
ncbi:MAG: hypothetical protein A2177_15215 [Spirochaetes bacterium RBG_13_68_11]|nr:MAG: hypothetical protein A2177_15215 [Spirochaetes bacterium RBG_13_68_11]